MLAVSGTIIIESGKEWQQEELENLFDPSNDLSPSDEEEGNIEESMNYDVIVDSEEEE